MPSFPISRFTDCTNLAWSDLELASEDLFQGHFPLEIFSSKLSKLSKLLCPELSGMKINRRIPYALALLISVACLSFALTIALAGRDSIEVTFTDVAKSSGIDFVNASSSEKKYIVESMAGGVAMFDFDNDGLLDIYLVNSYSVEAS